MYCTWVKGGRAWNIKTGLVAGTASPSDLQFKPTPTDRSPVYAPATLWEWWRDGGVKGRARALGDVLSKACLNLDVMDRLDVVGRTSEMARVFGIDFYSVWLSACR